VLATPPPAHTGGIASSGERGFPPQWPVPSRCPCRRGRYRLRFKGTLLLLRKENFEMSASDQLAPWHTPIPKRAVVDTGAGPSVIRAAQV